MWINLFCSSIGGGGWWVYCEGVGGAEKGWRGVVGDVVDGGVVLGQAGRRVVAKVCTEGAGMVGGEVIEGRKRGAVFRGL